MVDENSMIVSSRDLTKCYPQGDRDVEVLHGISLDLRRGEIAAISGPSGAGKSTLLHVLGLMDPPSQGTLVIEGRDVHRLSPGERARLRNQTIGFLFQFHHLLSELTVLENVELPQRIQGRPPREAAERSSRLLASLGMQNHLHKRPTALSGGEQQRVALARALVNEPALVLADEPTGNLDRETGETVLRLLFDELRRRQASAVIVTHQDDIARRADRWIRLRDGRIAVN